MYHSSDLVLPPLILKVTVYQDKKVSLTMLCLQLLNKEEEEEEE